LSGNGAILLCFFHSGEKGDSLLSPFFCPNKYDIFCVARAVETTEVLAIKHDKGLCFSGNKWYIG